ncbi:MAG: TlpA family protein disulfide reductase [Nitrospirae bacterium]|nr:MAG: TlpA family protein disulfide reductase [Nitrospirota bacterium]
MKNKGFVLGVIFAVGLAAVLLIATSGEQTPRKAAIGVEAPKFELKDITGKTWRLADLKGKAVLLNFWATWCDTCKSENPSLQRLVVSEWNNTNFMALSVLFKDDPKNAVEYVKQTGFNLPVLIDDKKISAAYGLTGVPETFLIDKKGVIVKKVIGPVEWDAPDVKAYLSKMSAD